MPPSGENLTALSTRLTNTCRSRSASPCTSRQSPGSTVHSISIDRLRALGARVARDVGEQPSDDHGPFLHGHGAALELGEIEKAHDELEQLLSLVVDGLREFLLIAHQGARDALHQHLAVADDGGERRAQLVRNDAEEVRLQAIELPQAIERFL